MTTPEAAPVPALPALFQPSSSPLPGPRREKGSNPVIASFAALTHTSVLIVCGREVFDPVSIEQLIDPARDAESELVRSDSLRLLEPALAQLEVDHRAVFTLFELDGLTCVAIAETLELPLGTVYSRLRRAREVLKKTIDEQQHVPLARLAKEAT